MKILRSILRSALLPTALVMVAHGPSQAGDNPAITVELNNAQQTAHGCTLSFIFRNGLPGAIEAMSLEVVLFNKEGLVDKFLRLKTGPLPTAKMRVKQFALKGRICVNTSRILINDVPECKGGPAPLSCLGALKASSRTGIKLTL